MSAKNEKSSFAEPLDLQELLHLFRQHLGKILACLAVCLAFALCYLHFARPVYQSRALLEVEQDPKADAGDSDLSDTLKTMELKLASQPVLLGVIKANHLESDADFMAGGPFLVRAWSRLGGAARSAGHYLSSLGTPAGKEAPGSDSANSSSELIRRLDAKISVSVVRGSRLIAVTAEDHDPVMAQRLAQSVLDQFYQQAWDAQHADAKFSRDLLEAEAKRVGAESEAAEVKLQAYRARYNAVSLEVNQNIVVERLRDLNQQVTMAKNARAAMETDQEEIRRLSAAAPEQLLSIREIAAAPEVIDLRKAVVLQEAQMAMLAKRYGPRYPTMIQSASQLDELQQALNRAIRKAGSLVLQSYESAKATEAALEAALARQEQTALDLDKIAIPYHALEREVAADAATYQHILDKLQQADVDHGLVTVSDVDGNNIRVVEHPLVPLRPAGPAPRLWLAISAAAGLMMGCGSALVARALDNTMSSVDGTETFLGLPVLIAVPKGRNRRGADLGPAVVTRPASPEAEAFRTLRTSLSLLPGGGDQRTVLFASAVPGEGKSYCSMNYASALAQQGLRTLLIDGDLRRPSLQGVLGLASPEKGRALSDCLRQPELLAASARPTQVENLFLLNDSEGRAGGAELVARDGMAELIRRATEAFDRVVIDSAPLIAVSDALHVAKHVQTLCLVVHAGRTPRRLVRRACGLLQDVAGRSPTGIVLNQTPRGFAASYDYYYSEKVYA
ncbi:MAG TPA: polysaccharide biosynthesis tyrosine autokinase [Opitutaceae bacterium]|nr:polysaccharide biosynthesis tyrosine autokinase [Opitutaceae bacterium]